MLFHLGHPYKLLYVAFGKVFNGWNWYGIDDAVNITSELHDPNAQKSHMRNKKKRPNREHRCSAGQIPSEGQVKTILTILEC